MAKSIETIWKEGFINEPYNSVPKINNLYNRKSQNIVDRLQTMFSINSRAIIIGSIINLGVMSLIGAPLLGVYICCLLAPLIVIVRKEVKKSTNLSKGQSSYDYLMNFNQWLQNSIDVYSRYYRFFYPLLFLGMAIQAVVSSAGARIIALLLEKLPTEYVILGVPYYLAIFIVLGTAFFARYAVAIYQWDLNLIYGRQFKKLAELIADMQELRQPA